MLIAFLFSNTAAQVECFSISNNWSSGDEEFKKSLKKGNLYRFIYKDYGNTKLGDSMIKTGYVVANFHYSGKYIRYIEDQNAQLVYSFSNIAGRLFKNLNYPISMDSRFKEFSQNVRQGSDWPNYEFDSEIIDTSVFLVYDLWVRQCSRNILGN